MNIYNQKQRWKIWLSVAAALFVGASLWYSNEIVKQIASDERSNVELWADAVKKRAELVKYTELLFNRLRDEERKRTEIWAEAIQNLSSSNDSRSLSFYLKVVTSNTTIPALIVDKTGIINSPYNVENGELYINKKFQGSIRREFSEHPPIIIDDGFGNSYSIYYKNSKIFDDLQSVMNDLIKSFISEVVSNSASVPVVIADSAHSRIIASGNFDKSFIADTVLALNMVRESSSETQKFSIQLSDIGLCYIYFQDSSLLRQLRYFPYVQLVVIASFILIAYFLFNFSRRAEQNQVWVGMSKETAHQLGTPLSSLLAWIEILRFKGVDEETLTEINKDLERLQTITERFSKIGSNPVLNPESIEKVLRESLGYMQKRSPGKVKFDIRIPEELQNDFKVKLNVPLFDWVIENLIRNAIDAMEGAGDITVELQLKPTYLAIDISDTGKGIPKSKLTTVFEPGYTSKKRGWGLGLSLTKRIIENYHKGKIFVKKSELGKGTTFRIQLRVDE